MLGFEERLKTLFETANDLFQILLPDGRFIYANLAWHEQLGYTSTELLHLCWFELVHPNDRGRLRALLSQLQTTEQTLALETTLIAKDGRAIAVEGQFCYQPATDQPGKIWGIWHTVTQSKPSNSTPANELETLLQKNNHTLEAITNVLETIIQARTTELAEMAKQLRQETLKREQAEKALQKSETRYWSIITALKEGIILQDANRVIYDYSPSALQILGRKANQLLGRSFLDPSWHAIHEDGTPFSQAANPALNTLQTGQPCTNTIVGIHKADGSLVWLLVHAEPLFAIGEISPYAVVLSFSDITLQKQAEAELRASETCYRAIVEDQTNFVCRFLPDGTLTFVNNAYCQLLGMPREELLGHLAEQQLLGVELGLSQLLSPLHPAKPIRVLEQQATLPNGEVRWFNWTSRALFDHQGYLVEFQLVGQDITRQKQADLALRESEERFQIFMDNSPVVAFMKDAEGRIVYVNARYEELFAKKKADILGKTDFDILSSEIAEPLRVNDLQILATGQPAELMEFVPDSEGNLRNWIVFKFPVMGTNNQRLLGGVAIDITERIQADAALWEMSAALSNAIEGISRLDTQGHYLTVNRAYATLVGYTPDEMIGLHWQKTVHPEDIELAIAAYEQMLNQGKAEVEIRGLCKDGAIIHKSVVLVATYDQQKNFIGHHCFAKDISDRKHAEAKLRESEEQFRQLAENINEVFFITSADLRRILYASPAYERVWGQTCASLYQKPDSWLNALHPDDLAPVLSNFPKMSQGEPIMQECRIVRPDHSMRWILCRTFPVYSKTGKLVRHVGLAEDITLRKQIEDELLQALEKERELNELKSRFVSMISHEFRTPLTTIQSAAELLEYYEWSAAEQQERFQQIRDAVQHMTHLLEDVLVIDKTDSGQSLLNLTWLDPIQFCQKLVAEFQTIAGQNHQISWISQGEPQIIQADLKMFRQILNNLLSNAVKYSPDGGVIELGLIFHPDHITVYVQDTGVGIHPDDQAHLFEIFYRARNVGTIHGTGLGLSIVKRCVDLHNGKIAVRSEIEVGTRFTVTLPLEQLTTE